MKKRIIASLLCVAVIATSLFLVVACNDKDANTPTSFEMPVGTRPDYDSLISSTDKAIIDKGLAESAKAESDEQKIRTQSKPRLWRFTPLPTKAA